MQTECCQIFPVVLLPCHILYVRPYEFFSLPHSLNVTAAAENCQQKCEYDIKANLF
jgi:hypothetical protein